MNNRLIFLLTLFIFNFFLLPAFAQEQSVTVQGQAVISGINLQTAQKKALTEAFRNAVEKGLGVWIKSQTEVQDFQIKKDEILTRSEGYVTDHEIIQEGEENGIYTVTIKAQIAVDRIGADLKQLLGRVKTMMGNPSISFVLTTWENKGLKTTTSVESNSEVNNSLKASSGVIYAEAVESDDQTYVEAVSGNPNLDLQFKAKVKKENSFQQMDETIWKKYPDLTVIDSFKQEFLEKGFDLKAADQAMNIALAESLAQTGINIADRSEIRNLAEKEGTNFIARGELQIIDQKVNSNTGSYLVAVKAGVEIIDVNSGDIIASYSNTANASSSSEQNARAQAIKKIAVLAAKTLSGQTIDKWQERASNGMKYTIEVRNITSARSQKLPFLKALKEVAQITVQTAPKENVLLIEVMYKGKKDELGEAIIEQIGSEKGFSEKEFEGPDDEGGKIIFRFTSGAKNK